MTVYQVSALPRLGANRSHMNLTLHSDLSNEAAAEGFGNLHADRNLTANIQGSVSNQRGMEAGDTLSLAAAGNLTQTDAGNISGKDLHISMRQM